MACLKYFVSLQEHPLFMNSLFPRQEVDDKDRRKESHLVAGLVRRTALPGC